LKDSIKRLLENIPDYKCFLTIEEMDESSRKLAASYPDVVTLTEIGKSRSGHALLCLKIGNGERNAIMYGLPHPNEPIGTMLMEHFTQRLAEDKELRDDLGYTWYILKAQDPDGYKLNEGWIKGPFTIHNYARNFFRPAMQQQTDWTFPIDYKELHFHDVLPETQAMKDLIDSVKPHFMYSLHNAGFGGVFWYITRALPSAYEPLREVARKHAVPLHNGEPESPTIEILSQAFYRIPGIDEEYDYLEKYGVKDIPSVIKGGNCSDDYAKNTYGTFTMLTELPYFHDARIDDLSYYGRSRREVVLEKIDWSEKNNQIILSILETAKAYVDGLNPFYLALKDFTIPDRDAAERKRAMEEAEYDRGATVAEWFDNILVNRFYKLLSYGMLVRTFESELADPKTAQDEQRESSLLASLDKALEMFEKLADELENEFQYDVIPIKKLVSILIESALHVLHGLDPDNFEA